MSDEAVGLIWSYGLAAVGILGIVLAGRKNAWGWAVGLGAQSLWIVYAAITAQYGFIVSAIVYAAVYYHNWSKWIAENKRDREAAAIQTLDKERVAGLNFHQLQAELRDVPVGPIVAEVYKQHHATKYLSKENHYMSIQSDLEASIRAADRKIAELTTARDEARQELESLRFPAEPTAGLITFELIQPNGSLYEYAARKAANNRWYTTGATCPPNGFSWRGLVLFMRKADRISGNQIIEHRREGWYSHTVS